MLRSRQETEQLVRKFEEILPFLKTQKNFGWLVPQCDRDPVYTIYPDYVDPNNIAFKKVTVNIQTGWHSEFIYRNDKGVHRVNEGTVQIQNDWQDVCYKSCCGRTVYINPPLLD